VLNLQLKYNTNNLSVQVKTFDKDEQGSYSWGLSVCPTDAWQEGLYEEELVCLINDKESYKLVYNVFGEIIKRKGLGE